MPVLGRTGGFLGAVQQTRSRDCRDGERVGLALNRWRSSAGDRAAPECRRSCRAYSGACQKLGRAPALPVAPSTDRRPAGRRNRPRPNPPARYPARPSRRIATSPHVLGEGNGLGSRTAWDRLFWNIVARTIAYPRRYVDAIYRRSAYTQRPPARKPAPRGAGRWPERDAAELHRRDVDWIGGPPTRVSPP